MRTSTALVRVARMCGKRPSASPPREPARLAEPAGLASTRTRGSCDRDRHDARDRAANRPRVREVVEGRPEESSGNWGYAVAGVPHVVVLAGRRAGGDVGVRGAGWERRVDDARRANVNLSRERWRRAIRNLDEVWSRNAGGQDGAVASATLLGRGAGRLGGITSNAVGLACRLLGGGSQLLRARRGEGRLV